MAATSVTGVAYTTALRYSETTPTRKYLSPEQAENLKIDVLTRLDEFKWKTYGPSGSGELTEKNLVDLETAHLENILITQPQIDNDTAAAILFILRSRYQYRVKSQLKGINEMLKETEKRLKNDIEAAGGPKNIDNNDYSIPHPVTDQDRIMYSAGQLSLAFFIDGSTS